MPRTIKSLQVELKRSSHQGAPIIAGGALYFATLFGLSFFIDVRVLQLIWVVGLGAVFPLGILIAQIFKLDLFVKGNALGALAGIVGGIQALYIPVYIVAYKFFPEWLPFLVGTMTAAHFIPYIWLYKSKIYAYMIASMALVSIVFGSIHQWSYTAVPLGIAIIYAVSAALLAVTSKKTTSV